MASSYRMSCTLSESPSDLGNVMISWLKKYVARESKIAVPDRYYPFVVDITSEPYT